CIDAGHSTVLKYRTQTASLLQPDARQAALHKLRIVPAAGFKLAAVQHALVQAGTRTIDTGQPTVLYAAGVKLRTGQASRLKAGGVQDALCQDSAGQVGGIELC